MIKVLVLLLSLVFTIQQSIKLEHVEIARTILDSYMEGSPKELFKVFHYIFEKPYDLNSQAALAKYKVFKKNLSMIKEHNAKGLSWTLEINFFGDMSDEEITSYMGLAPVGDLEVPSYQSVVGEKNFDLFDQLVAKEEGRNLKELSFFDQLADDDDDPTPPKDLSVKDNDVTYDNVDHSAFMTTPRNQGSCGSCWAFATTGAIEGNYNRVRVARGQEVSNEYISPQAVLDCNPSKYGCEGGWMNVAILSVAQNGAKREKDYAYQGIQNSQCNNNAASISDLKFDAKTPIEGCAWTSWFKGFKPCTKDTFYKTLKAGPTTVVLMAERNFSRYRSGVIEPSVIPDCVKYNHAVIAVAWTNQVDHNNVSREVITIRNSWGPSYGDKGNVKYYYTDDGSCFITKFALRPRLE